MQIQLESEYGYLTSRASFSSIQTASLSNIVPNVFGRMRAVKQRTSSAIIIMCHRKKTNCTLCEERKKTEENILFFFA